MFDRVEMARRNDEAVIKSALREWDEGHYYTYAQIVRANQDLAGRIRQRIIDKLRKRLLLARKGA